MDVSAAHSPLSLYHLEGPWVLLCLTAPSLPLCQASEWKNSKQTSKFLFFPKRHFPSQSKTLTNTSISLVLLNLQFFQTQPATISTTKPVSLTIALSFDLQDQKEQPTCSFLLFHHSTAASFGVGRKHKISSTSLRSESAYDVIIGETGPTTVKNSDLSFVGDNRFILWGSFSGQ